MSHDSDRRREGQLSRDPETIRRWADERGAVPVRETAGPDEPERFAFLSEHDVDDTHERVEWETFLELVDEHDLVVVSHGEEADEPLRVAGHDDVLTDVDDEEIEERLLQGETVTSTITETSVVERVVVEEAEVESELVDTEVLDEQVVDVELLERQCTSCELVDDPEGDPASTFDADRFLATVGGGPAVHGTGGTPGLEDDPGGDRETGTGETMTDTGPEVMEDADTETTTYGTDGHDALPYHAALDVEERWRVTREYLERHTVESRISGTSVTEADTIEDHDIDVSGLHRSIVESGILAFDSPEDALEEAEVESTLAADDRIETSFTRERTLVEEILERARLRADVTEREFRGMERVRTEATGAESTGTVGETGDAMGGTAAGADAGPGAETGTGTGAGAFSDDDVGKPVVDAEGREIGMITDVEESGSGAYVETDPGIAQRIQAALGWGDRDEDAYRLPEDDIAAIRDDEVELKRTDDLTEKDR